MQVSTNMVQGACALLMLFFVFVGAYALIVGMNQVMFMCLIAWIVFSVGYIVFGYLK